MAHSSDKFPTPEGTFFPLNLVTSFDKRSARLDVCKSCDSLKMGFVCGDCGCYVQAKTWLATAECPQNKWENDLL